VRDALPAQDATPAKGPYHKRNQAWALVDDAGEKERQRRGE
jgi:hypothetical protein